MSLYDHAICLSKHQILSKGHLVQQIKEYLHVEY